MPAGVVAGRCVHRLRLPTKPPFVVVLVTTEITASAITVDRKDAMRPARSVASRVFLVLLVAALVVGGLVAVFLVVDAQRATHAEAERVTAATAFALAASPLVIGTLETEGVDEATQILEPYALDVIADASSTS